MIHIFIGTKAQYVKMAPVMLELKHRGIEFNLIDSGQHAELTKFYRRFFGLPRPQVVMRQRGDIAGVLELGFWMLKWFIQGLLCSRRIKRILFGGHGGVCLIHGDTPTTMISCFLAKRCGIEVGHVEAGLFTGNILDPVPEELIRRWVVKRADYLYATDADSAKNLQVMKVKGEIVRTNGNTSIDALIYGLAKMRGKKPSEQDYFLVSFHRAENVLSRERLRQIVAFIEELCDRRKVILFLNPFARRKLTKAGLMEGLLKIPRLVLKSSDEPDFLSYLSAARAVITDGCGMQEESAHLGVPCLLLRKHTERSDGLKRSVVISRLDPGIMRKFAADPDRYRRRPLKPPRFSPSAQIIDHLERVLEHGRKRRRHE